MCVFESDLTWSWEAQFSTVIGPWTLPYPPRSWQSWRQKDRGGAELCCYFWVFQGAVEIKYLEEFPLLLMLLLFWHREHQHSSSIWTRSSPIVDRHLAEFFIYLSVDSVCFVFIKTEAMSHIPVLLWKCNFIITVLSSTSIHTTPGPGELLQKHPQWLSLYYL